MKKKDALTKKGKQKLKEEIFLIGFCLVVLAFGFVFMWSGIDFGITSIKDYRYLDNPQTVLLYDWEIEQYQSRSVLTNYVFYGVDKNNTKYDFILGKYSFDTIEKLDKKMVMVHYLPNSKIIMKLD